MWEFLWSVFRGLVATFLMALVLDYIGRKHKIFWILGQSKKKMLAFIWTLEIIGALSFFTLFETKSVVLFALVWIGCLMVIFEISKIWKFNLESEATFLQITFCSLWLPMIGAGVFFLPIFVYLWWPF